MSDKECSATLLISIMAILISLIAIVLQLVG